MDTVTLKDFLCSEQEKTLKELANLTKREGTTEWGIEDEEKRFKLRAKYEILTEIILICLTRNRF